MGSSTRIWNPRETREIERAERGTTALCYSVVKELQVAMNRGPYEYSRERRGSSTAKGGGVDWVPQRTVKKGAEQWQC